MDTCNSFPTIMTPHSTEDQPNLSTIFAEISLNASSDLKPGPFSPRRLDMAYPIRIGERRTGATEPHILNIEASYDVEFHY